VLRNYGEDNTPGLAKWAGPGHWNDADMLEIGNGGVSLTEEQSQFTLWSEMASPLLLSTDLTELSPAELAIIKNKGIIAVDQDKLGAQGTIVQRGSGYNVLAKPLSNGDVAVVLFNKGDKAQTISTTAANVGLGSGAPLRLTDLVSKQRTESSGVIASNVPAHGTVIYRVHPYSTDQLPVAASVSMAAGTLSVGRPGPVTVTLTDQGSQKITKASVRLQAPGGWSVQPKSQQFATIGAGGSATATFQVTRTAPAPGPLSSPLVATVNYQSAHGSATASGEYDVVTDVPYPSLAAAFNNVGISSESDPATANFDGDGDSYSAEALATAGATPGDAFTSNGATFTWPAAAAGSPDNVAGGGVKVKLSDQGSALAFLGAEAGFTTDTVTVTYTDGTTSTGSLGFPNWCCASTTTYGAKVAISTDHRDTPSGPANFGTAYDVFYNSIPLDAGKTVATVTLPASQAIHVFAMAVQS
jgi:hypothetical protein